MPNSTAQRVAILFTVTLSFLMLASLYYFNQQTDNKTVSEKPDSALVNNSNQQPGSLDLDDLNSSDKVTDDKAEMLFRSAALGDISDVKKLLMDGVDVNKPIKNKLTPLIIAAYAGHERVVKILLAAKANPNFFNRDLESPLITASASPNADRITELLLKAGASIKHQDKFNRTPLIAHAQKGHLKAVKMLIKAGSNIDHRDIDGQNAIHVAAMKGHTEVVEYLISTGGKFRNLSQFKVTPLMVAARGGHSTTVSLLLKNGSNALRKGPEEFNAFGFAVLSGNWNTIESFRTAGIPLSSRVSSVGAVLHTAIAYKKRYLVAELVHSGAPVNQISESLSPLMISVARGDIDSFRFLLKMGAKPNLKNKGGATALLLASYMGKLELVKLLIENGADIHQTNHQGGTALRSAAAGGHTEVVKFLLRKGSRINTLDKFGKYPIDYAKEKGHHNVISLLQTWKKETASKLP